MNQGPGRVVALHGGKAGEGKSLLAENLAAAWAAEGRRVLLLDLDCRACNSQLVRGGITKPVVLAGLPDDSWPWDEAGVGGFPRTACGVEAAVLAVNPQQALETPTPKIVRFIEKARQRFAAVVVDSLCGFDCLALSVLDAVDLILAVCPPDLAGLRQALAECGRYSELKFPAAKIGLILNRADLPGAVSPAEIGKIFPQHVLWGSVPFAVQAVEAVHAQRPLVRLYPHSLFAGAVKALARKIFLAEFPPPGRAGAAAEGGRPPDYSRIKQRLHRRLLDDPELKTLACGSGRSADGRMGLRARVETVVAGLMANEAAELTARAEREQLAREVVDEALGLGPLEDLMRDPDITDIMVNGCSRIYIEKAGRLHATDKCFLREEHLRTVVEKIIAPLGRRLDESQPYVDARLSDGSRVHALIPPLSLHGPVVTIRKFSRRRFEMGDLIASGSLSAAMADFLAACVAGRKNLVISGGTGSGKTTLLNILAGLIPPGERIITIEDAAELNLPQPHVVSLEARPDNLEGKGGVAIRELVRNSLRMRPDRIVVGECRGGEALDMLQAMNTGHDGSLTTAHANSPRDLLLRLETMVLMSGLDLPVRAIRQQIAGAVHIIIQQERLQDGSRKITRISEILGEKEGQVSIQDIFSFRQTGLDSCGRVLGSFAAAGYVPACVRGLKARGVSLKEKIFAAS